MRSRTTGDDERRAGRASLTVIGAHYYSRVEEVDRDAEGLRHGGEAHAAVRLQELRVHKHAQLADEQPHVRRRVPANHPPQQSNNRN